MSVLGTLIAYNRLRRTQWLDPNGLRRLQEAKLRRLVRHAYRTVPYYQRLFDSVGLAPDDIRSPADLAKMPITTKAQLLAAGPGATSSSAYRPEDLVQETTSGSTGQPFTTRFDRHFSHVRKALFLRTLVTAGYRAGHKVMLVTSLQGKVPRPRLRYASLLDPPDQLLAAVNAYGPDILYGCVTPLRQLACLVHDSRVRAHRPRAVICTAETLDERSRGLIADALGAKVFDVFGLTEMGLVAWQCGETDGYHLAEDTTVTEFLPAAHDSPAARLVMTNLELGAMPFIRFETGDLGVPGATSRCACGRSLRRLDRVEGRIVDCVRLQDGRVLSPYRLTLALEAIPGLRRYQVIQESADLFTVRYEAARAGGEPGADTAGAVETVLRGILGSAAQLRLQPEFRLATSPGRKFRVVESRLGAEAAS